MNVVIYIPTRGHVWHETAAALGAYSPRYVRCTTGVSDARHLIVKDFLASDGDICVMCDDDVVPPELWGQILNPIDELKADVVAGVAPIGMEGTIFLPNVFIRDDSLSRGYRLSTDFLRETGVQEVDAVGTGLIAISRRVLLDKRMREPFRADFSGKGTGEDVQFCKRAKECGYKVAVDFDVWCDHMVEIHANGIANAYMTVLNASQEAQEKGDTEWVLDMT